MSTRTVSAIMLALLLTSMLTLAYEAPSVEATSTAFGDVKTRILEPGDDLIHGFVY
jgi:hypothetical protein